MTKKTVYYRWNDYESNISSSFRDFRQASELYDVTLCCDNGTDTVQVRPKIELRGLKTV